MVWANLLDDLLDGQLCHWIHEGREINHVSEANSHQLHEASDWIRQDTQWKKLLVGQISDGAYSGYTSQE